VAAVHSFRTVKAVVQIATVDIAVNDLPQTRRPETVRPREPIVIDLNEVLEVVFTAAVIIRPLRVSWSIDSHRKRHWQLVNRTRMEGSTITIEKILRDRIIAASGISWPEKNLEYLIHEALVTVERNLTAR
jgi:hypothetical protein